MKELLFASFNDREDADNAIDELKDFGYKTEDISIITSRENRLVEGRTEIEEKTTSEKVASGAGSGIVTGGIIGGLAGLLAGAAGLIIVGPIAALFGLAGVLGTAITGLVMGVAIGGLAGALINLGLPKETAESYEKTVMAGGVVLSVPLDGYDRNEVRQILDDNNAEDVTELTVNK